MGSSLVQVTYTSVFAPVSSKEFFAIYATRECRLTLNRLRGMRRTYNGMHPADNYSQHSSVIWVVCPNGLVSVYELCGCGFTWNCSHSFLRYFSALSKKLLLIQATVECGITLSHAYEIIRTYS